jgi:hypothetical protein
MKASHTLGGEVEERVCPVEREVESVDSTLMSETIRYINLTEVVIGD